TGLTPSNLMTKPDFSNAKRNNATNVSHHYRSLNSTIVWQLKDVASCYKTLPTPQKNAHQNYANNRAIFNAQNFQL
ncbi:MAG: hypothetical protein L3J38_06620, partial [Thiomicrorhabdus sp.]|nr:hypothetical protein [Thiomicrorhabdus sp.]